MSQELIYTSAPKGLKLGARGFCTVASTPGMAKNLADRLESLSGYRHLYQPGSPEAHLNPINFSYLKFTLGGQPHHVLSRIADAGLDYTQRTNKLAHHIVLHTSELSAAGPAWLASQPGIFETTWTRDPELLPNDHRPIPQGRLNTEVCSAWKLAAGDAGWAGVLAEHILKNGSDEAYLIYRPGTDVLELLVEAQALLPSDQRWAATFSTYFTKLPPGIECRWRGVVEGSPEAIRARRSPGKLVIDLTAAKPIASGGELVAAARDGPRVRESTKVETNKASTSPTADFPLGDRLPAGWDFAKHEPGSFVSIGSRPPALPQRRHTGWTPISIAKGLSRRERAIWLSLILILLASLGGSTFYFARRSFTVPEPVVASADETRVDPAFSNTKLHKEGVTETAASQTAKSTQAGIDETVENASTNIDNLTKEPPSGRSSALSTEEESSGVSEPIRGNGVRPLASETPNTGSTELQDQPDASSRQPGSDAIPLKIELNQQFQANGLPKFDPSELPTPWKKKQPVAELRDPIPRSIDFNLIEAHDRPEKLSIARQPEDIWEVFATNKSSNKSSIQRRVGTFEVAHGELVFQGASSGQHSGATALRDSVLAAKASAASTSRLIPLFRVVREVEPIDWKVDWLLESGKWEMSLDELHPDSQEPITIPNGQDSVACVRSSIIKDNEVTLRPDEQSMFAIGAPPVARLSVSYAISSERQPSLGVKLLDPEDGKLLFRRWRKQIAQERIQYLKSAIADYINNPKFVPYWLSLSKELDFPIDSHIFLDELKRNKSLDQLRQLEQNIHAKLTKYLTDPAPKGRMTPPQEPRHSDLVAHEGKYPNFYIMEEEIRDVLKRSPISLKISRLIRSTDQGSETHQIDVFVAGQF